MRLVLTTLAMLFAATAALAAEKFIPAAGHVPGANGTFFRTNVRIVNLASTAATFDLAWLPSNSDNSAPLTATVTIAARASLQLDDVALSLFGVASGSGAIRITSTADFAGTSRTFTASSADGCPGTFGQFIPAVSATDALQRGVLANIRTSSEGTPGFRSNAGVVNPSMSPVSVTLRLRAGNGASLGEKQLELAPLGHTQLAVAATFGVTTTEDNLFLELDASRPVIAYASVIDNESGDPIFVAASPDSGTPAPVATTITARQWQFEPALIEARVGEERTVILRALDVDHGIGVSGVGPVSCTSEQGGICVLRPGEDVTIRFTPREAGTFAFFCTRFCGAAGEHGHETMRGTLVVR